MKKRENCFHEFRKGKHLKLQDYFVFVDTESMSTQLTKDKKVLTFKMGCSIFWNRKLNLKKEIIFYNINDFWNDIEKFFKAFDISHLLMFAHNTQFDFKMLNGFNQLLSRDWELISQYVKNKTFILIFKKGKQTLHIWDTTNYAPEKLENIGESIGFPKLKVDFDNVSNKELEIYCMRDTEIIFQFIKKLVNFLQVNDLSRLKATAASLSFNSFRHKFYNPENIKIFIHNHKRTIKLERESYRGGITDVFKVGKSQEQLIKLDINSMYSKTMKDKKLPTKLIFNLHEFECEKRQYTIDKLKEIYQISKDNGYGVIIYATIQLSKENAYILNKFKGKSLFVYGEFKISLCTPEIEFVEQYGKIIKIHEISVYEVENIFEQFVDFFYDKRNKAKQENNKIDNKFCKLMLNSQYGKWGQREIEYEKLDEHSEFLKWYKDIIELKIKRIKEKNPDFVFDNQMAYLGNIEGEGELYVVNHGLYLLKHTSKNAYDSFVAIASFITSYSRMLLIKYLLIAERENVYYCDTDSLVVNEIGYNNLLRIGFISESELGLLKIEDKGIGSFYSPKFYDFNTERKCKGIKKDSLLLLENDVKTIHKIELWQRWKTDLSKGYTNQQIITLSKKQSNKIYTKGKVNNNGIVIPFLVDEVENK